MRLWHESLIPRLDSNRLCDLHRTCCNLRGMGWGKRNSMVNFVFDDRRGEEALSAYHIKVLNEMAWRNFKFDTLWLSPSYCGKRRMRRPWDPDLQKQLQHEPLIYPQINLEQDMADLHARGAKLYKV